MNGRHRGRRTARRRTRGVLTVVAVAIAVGVYLLAVRSDGGRHLSAGASGAAAPGPPVTSAAPESANPTGSGVRAPAASPTSHTAAARRGKHAADAAIAKLLTGRRPGSVSVAVLDPATGASYRYGARGGMWMASIAKLDILEVMLLQHQDTGELLSDAEDAYATSMIEHSDNAAADWLYGNSVGARDGVITANKRLGLRCTVTGPGYYWGLGTTCAADQVTLLRHLLDPHGPLHAKARAYALDLLGHVESDQRWGVGAAADAGTSFVNKNGWLAVDDDGGLWTVNSDGIITAHGRRLLVSVLTQHNAAFRPGVALNEAIAKIAVPLVAP